MLKTVVLFLIFFGAISEVFAAKNFETKINQWNQSNPSSKVKKLNAFYQMYWEYLMTTYPEWATHQGYPGQNDRWTDISLEGIEQQKNETRLALKALSTISEKGLKGEDLLNFRLLKFRLQDEINNFQFPGEYLAIDQMGGVHSSLADLFQIAPKRNVKDYNDMLVRLESSALVIDQTIALLNEGLKKGITQPKVTLVGLPAQFEKLLPEKIEDSPIYKAFSEIPVGILSAEKASAFQARVKTTISGKVYPALKKLREFLVNEYIPRCRETIGQSALPNGVNWYNARIKTHTTVDLTSDQIHQLGLSEVKRIRTEMDHVREQLKFKGSFKEFNEHLKDSKFYFSKAEDLIERFRSIGKAIDPELPKFFGKLPRLTYGIIEMPTFKAPSSAAAYYEGGSLEAGRAGNFVANTYDLKARPKWAMIDLTCHEAVPGHHFQISIAQEIEGLPEFRKNMHYTSYVEGWGLYAETICDDMGLYKNPYDKYGQLTAEMWRAVRLVVDTGIHAKGWTREQVVNYFREAGPFAEQEIQAETNRYIVWAGQALAYKIGQLKIKELRDNSKKILGEKFDVRKFHDQILNSGALPLPVLEQKILDWTNKDRTKAK
ncbi:MAG: DUF885 domain-containing protein [Bdellovibrionota bacterium]